MAYILFLKSFSGTFRSLKKSFLPISLESGWTLGRSGKIENPEKKLAARFYLFLLRQYHRTFLLLIPPIPSIFFFCTSLKFPPCVCLSVRPSVQSSLPSSSSFLVSVRTSELSQRRIKKNRQLTFLFALTDQGGHFVGCDKGQTKNDPVINLTQKDIL